MTARRLLILGALAAVIGLAGAIVTDSATKLSYQVFVVEPPTSGRLPVCRPTRIALNPATGEELPCSGSPEGGFTPAERRQIVATATTLAADGRLDPVDEFQLKQLAAELGLRHEDDSSHLDTWAFRALGILGAGCLVTGIALRIVERRAGRRR